jgi:serine/threonine protein phosphatase PrpC
MLEAYGRTDVGRRRKLNEDSFLVAPEYNLYAVCDGMGGHNAGEVASKMAIETLESFVEKSHREKEITWPYGLDVELSFEGNRIQTALKLANKKVFKAADNREEYTGMGTTVVAALAVGKMLTVGSAGDSRCYLLRDGALKQLTTDDSWVSAAWAEGILNAEEIERHPLRNVITRAVGAKETLEVNIVEQELQDGDLALLCSDGLHSMITNEQILKVLTPLPESLEDASAGLVAAANEAGGKDNVTVVLLRYTS